MKDSEKLSTKSVTILLTEISVANGCYISDQTVKERNRRQRKEKTPKIMFDLKGRPNAVVCFECSKYLLEARIIYNGCSFISGSEANVRYN